VSRSADTLDQLKADLLDQAEALLLALFGQPTQQRARWWRWGRKGSLSARLDRGTFYSFEADQGGGLLDAIMFANGCSFPEAVKWARAWLGTDEKQSNDIKARPPIDADAERDLALAEARALWRAGRSINATAGARYLQGRAIDGWPTDAVRLIAARDVARIATGAGEKGRGRQRWSWWRWPALMFPMTDDAGTVTAVQLIALTDQGEAAPHWEHGGKLKMVRGVAAGAAFRLPGDADGPLVLTEGGETGLSPWLATGLETWAVLGAIGRAPLDAVPLSRTIIVARDDDPPRSPARKAQRHRIAAWRAEGRHVVVAQPWLLSRGDKSDFNDVLQQDGPDAVRERIEAALRSPEPPPGTSRTDALLQLSTAIGRTTDRLIRWQGDNDEAPPFKVIRATLGLGKSQATLEAILEAIAAGHRVVYAAPTHDLCGEIAERARDLAEKRGRSITVNVWHGREREDPAAPGQTMCRDITAAELARRAGIDVLKTVCDAPCQFRDGCAYLAQREAVADLWITPHALLFAELPQAMAGASLLVIDEGFALAGIIGTDGPPLLVPLASLADQVAHGNGKAEASADLEAELRPIRAQLIEALADHPAAKHGEPLRRASLVAAGITADLADQARRAEGRRRRDVSAINAPTRADLLRELRAIMATNAAAKLAAMLWGHLANMLADDGPDQAGRVELVLLEDGTTRALRLYGLATMGKGWRALPTLHLDATADMALLRLRVPNAELVANIEAAEPHVAIHQIVGRTFGKGALHGTAADDARRFVLATAAEYGGRWLMVASKDAVDGWRPTLPPNVGAAHWGDVRGLDSFNDVRGLACIGRWGVSPAAVERMASILTGQAVPQISGWFPSEAVTLTAADGSARTVDADRHPDATAEAVRRALVDAELLQAIGRGRGVQRTEGTPLAVYVLGNVPLSLPLASLADWQPVDPSRAMLADHGAWLASAGDAATLTCRTRKAVERQREQQARITPCPYKRLLYGHGGNLPDGLATASYQRAGAGRSETAIVYDPSRIPDPRAWLEARLGPLAYFDGADFPTDHPPAESRPAARKPAGSVELPPMGEAYPSTESRAPPIAADQAAISDQYARAREDLASEGGHPVKNGPFGADQASNGIFHAVRAREAVAASPAPGRGVRFLAAPVELHAEQPPVEREFFQSIKGGPPAEFSGALKGAAQSDRDLTKPNIERPLADLKKPEARADLTAHPFWSTGGTMPAELVAFGRVLWRGAGISQQALADRAELSRPQLANAMQGRFGLSPAAAARLLEALTALPQRAPDLFDNLLS
jgi:putative DNA primase/helicase